MAGKAPERPAVFPQSLTCKWLRELGVDPHRGMDTVVRITPTAISVVALLKKHDEHGNPYLEDGETLATELVQYTINIEHGR